MANSSMVAYIKMMQAQQIGQVQSVRQLSENMGALKKNANFAN